MTKYKVLPVATEYWKPGQDYLYEILGSIKGKIADGDFVTVSEKAIAVSTNSILDEERINPGFSARFIAAVWMRAVWGYFLGILCHLGERTIQQIRHYPSKAGSRHKQVALQHTGLLQALMFGSEGGIDGSNLPFSYVSLPLNNAQEVAEGIRKKIHLLQQRAVAVMIVDTDSTYSFRNFHFTPRPEPLRGIHSFGGFAAYIAGRMLKLKRRATPIAVSGCSITVEEALEIAERANRSRGFGSGRTVWEMAANFKVDLNGVTWQMLETVKHKPIVILRSKRCI